MTAQDYSQAEAPRSCPQCNMEIEIADLACPTCGEILVLNYKNALAVYDKLNQEFGNPKKLMKKEFLQTMPSFRAARRAGCDCSFGESLIPVKSKAS